MTFSSASTCADQGPIELLIKDGHDLELWRNSIDRLVVLRTATGALLRPIFDELEERDRVAKCGGQIPAPLSSIPIIISRSVLNNKFVADIETSKHTNRLALEDAECLRTAVSRLMSEEFIASAYRKWRSSMEKPDAAFRKAEKEWYNTLARCLIDSLIHDSELHFRAQLLLMTEADRRAEAERQLQILLERGVELVSSPELYIKQIIDRPASKAEAERLLSTDAVAFRFSPTRGEDRGKELLAFSKSSLLRLLQRVSVTEKEYEAMLSECEKAGILGKKNWPINLGGETFNAAIAMVVVDEAHVLASDQHDFRKAYQKIGDFIAGLSQRPIVSAFTATATKRDRKIIIQSLGMVDPAKFVFPIRRKNLEIVIKVVKAREKDKKRDAIRRGKMRLLCSYVDGWDGSGSVIIYCPTVKEVKFTYKWLKANGYAVGKYHGKMKAAKRTKAQAAFMSGETPIMVATNAFGLGIDKPDVRMIIHVGLPLSLDGYVQEIGRAGRDGDNAACILIYSPTDYAANKALLMHATKKKRRREVLARLDALDKLVKSENCIWKGIERYFGEKQGK